MRSTLALILAIAGTFVSCQHDTPKDGYFLSETMEREDGTSLTVTYSGPKPPEVVFPSLARP